MVIPFSASLRVSLRSGRPAPPPVESPLAHRWNSLSPDFAHHPRRRSSLPRHHRNTMHRPRRDPQRPAAIHHHLL